jgi:hypothetical protein
VICRRTLAELPNRAAHASPARDGIEQGFGNDAVSFSEIVSQDTSAHTQANRGERIVMKIKTTVRGGLASAAVAVATPIINPRRGCPTTTTVRPVLTTAVLIA